MNCTSLFIYLFSKGYLLVAFDAREQSRPASTGEAMLTFITGASAQGVNCKERQPRPIGAFPTLPEDHVRCSPLCVIDFRPSVRHELPNPPSHNTSLAELRPSSAEIQNYSANYWGAME